MVGIFARIGEYGEGARSDNELSTTNKEAKGKKKDLSAKPRKRARSSLRLCPRVFLL